MTNTQKAYQMFETYVKKHSYGKTFNWNNFRTKLKKIKGLRPEQHGPIVATALSRGLIVRVGDTASTVPTHKSAKVGVFSRV